MKRLSQRTPESFKKELEEVYYGDVNEMSKHYYFTPEELLSIINRDENNRS